MEIELPDEFAKRILRYVDPRRGITTLDVLERAMDRYEEAESERAAISAEELQSEFHEFRGKLKMSREEMLDARRHGSA